jgi:hypothetical protein
MLFTTIVSLPAPEQNIDIIDQILNDDGTPADGAIVSLYKDGSYINSYTTLSDGVYEFRNLIKGSYEIQIVYSDEQGIKWRNLGKINQPLISPGITNFNIVSPVLNLSVENSLTTVTVTTPGTGYDPFNPPIIAADDGFTAIGIVNQSGVLTGLTSLIPGNGTATVVDTFNIPLTIDYITYYGNQSQTGGESTEDYSDVFYSNISAMAANISWNSGPLANRFSYFTSSGLNISVGSESAALTALNGQAGASFPNYVDKGLYAYPSGTITYQANIETLTPPSNSWKGGAYIGTGSNLSITFDVHQYGYIDYSGFFATKNAFPPKNLSGLDPQYRYELQIPENHPNVNGPGGWLEQLYAPCGVKTSIYDFLISIEQFNQAAIDSKRYASNLAKAEENLDTLYKDVIKKNYADLKLAGGYYVQAVKLFTLTGPLIDDDISILINNEFVNAPSMDTKRAYEAIIYMMTGLNEGTQRRWLDNEYFISEAKMAQFGCQVKGIAQEYYRYLTANGVPTATNTGIINPNYNPLVTAQVFNEVKGYLGGKYLPLVTAINSEAPLVGQFYSGTVTALQSIDQKLGSSLASAFVTQTSGLADFGWEAKQTITSGNLQKNYNDFQQQVAGLTAGVAPQYLWGKSYMTPATEYGYAWVHNWDQSNGAYTITKVNLGL